MTLSGTTRGTGLGCFLAILFIIGFAGQGKAAADAAKEAAPPAPPPAPLQAFLPAKVDELAHLEVEPAKSPSGSALWVAAYSYRDQQSTPHSAMIVVGSEDNRGKPKLLWKSQEEELYEPAVNLVPQLAYGDRPIVLVSRQKGAAWAQMDVIGFQNQQPRRLDTLEGERLVMVPLIAGAGPQILTYQRKYVSALPEILEWNGQKFVPASQKFPQFYETLARRGAEVLKESDYQPLEIALLTALAGHPAEARKQMEKLLSAEQSKGAKANGDLIKDTERELDKLKL